MTREGSPLLQALNDGTLNTSVVEVDMRRSGSGLAITTDYIIEVKLSDNVSFHISKTYTQFRALASSLKEIIAKYAVNASTLPVSVNNCLETFQQIVVLVEHKEKSYMGKINYKVAESLSLERRKIIDSVLSGITKLSVDVAHPMISECVDVIETFARTDHCSHGDNSPAQTQRGRITLDALKKVTSLTSNITSVLPTKLNGLAPLTTKRRRTEAERKLDKDDLQLLDANDTVILKDEVSPSPLPLESSTPRTLYAILQENQLAVIGAAPVVLYSMYLAASLTVTISLDILVLMVFAGFAMGSYTPHAIGFLKLPRSSEKSSFEQQNLIFMHRSILIGDITDTSALTMGLKTEQMNEFPQGASMGSHTNCWSKPQASTFHVRGSNYFKDKEKEPSGPFLFPLRRVELFLTDACPTHVAQNPDVLDGQLRDKATFIINFILPWGVLLFYFEIPERFLPFLEARSNPSGEPPSLRDVPSGDRAVCRWLMNSDEYKNQRFKIIPSVVEGPWVVKQAVGGKPALIGAKMPIEYHYQPRDGPSKHPYLEADLDIAASGVARGILSLVRKYTSALTINLGFVIEAKDEDELPEQMLVGACLHGIDPLICPTLPPMKWSSLRGRLIETG